jgi:nitrate reductase cytochrome c-type subunit
MSAETHRTETLVTAAVEKSTKRYFCVSCIHHVPFAAGDPVLYGKRKMCPTCHGRRKRHMQLMKEGRD